MATNSRYSCLGNPMDKGAWQGCSPWGCKRVGWDLGTKQQQQCILQLSIQHMNEFSKWICTYNKSAYMCVYIILCIYIYTYIHTYIMYIYFTHIYLHIYIYIYVCVCVLFKMFLIFLFWGELILKYTNRLVLHDINFCVKYIYVSDNIQHGYIPQKITKD